MRDSCNRLFLGVLALCALVLLTATPFARGAAYPERPIRLVVPYPPGGATDLIGRIVGKAIADELRAAVVVENKGGAAGSIGASEVAKAKPDGYTLLLAAVTSHAVYQHLYPSLARYDLRTDFAPVSIVGEVPQVLVAHPAVKARSLFDFIALAKANPGTISIASAGNGSTQQMAALLLAKAAGISLIQVPYKGSGPAMTDLIGGQVNAMFGTVPSVKEFIDSDRLRVLAVTSQTRLSNLPAAPTFSEQGIADFHVNSVFGVLAPAGTPADRVQAVSQAIGRALTQPAVRDSLMTHGVLVDFRGSDAARGSVNAEVQKWERVIQETGVKAE